MLYESIIYPKPILIKIINDEEFDLDLRLNLNRYLRGKFNTCESIKIPEQKGYFKIRLHEIVDEDWKLMKKQVIDKCNGVISTYSDRELKIPLSKLDDLFRHFLNKGNFNNYTLPKLITESNILWTKEIISKYPILRDLYYTSYRSDINWTFELLDEFKDKIYWNNENFVKSISHLKWSKSQILKFKNYFIFKNCDNYNNRKVGSLSLNTSINWDKNLIKDLKDYWCWTELCQNPSIQWDYDLIETFIDYIDFKSLSKNVGIKWDIKLIEHYLDKWDWEELSGNCSILMDLTFLQKYELKLYWKPKYDYTYDNECNDYPSISTNKGINWTLEMFEKFKDKLDLWRMTYNSKFDFNIINRYKKELDIKKHTGWKHHEYSDFMTVTERLYKTGWENLSLNSNFIINSENINFLATHTIELTYVEGGSLAGHGGGQYVTKEFKVIDILKNTEIDKDLIFDFNLEFQKYLNHFYNSNFINNTFWLNVVKPIIKNNFTNFINDL